MSAESSTSATAAPASHVISVQQKLDTAKQLKDTGDQAFKAGKVKEALGSYHQSLMYLHGLDKNALQSLGMASAPVSSDEAKDKDAKEKTEVDELLEKIYANMSACHLKNQNWARAVDTADKALKKNENNYKAMFRKGKALGEQGFFEKAVKILEDIKKKNPTDVAICDQEIVRLRVIDQAREKVHKQKLKGFLNKEKAKGALGNESDGTPVPA
ncbi:TPR-like protein [Coprinopsis marcescibilis]|uniref:TPR-like protein n=1 Tax=Coprinopsis marcescibilis TaxID=230819 RepID=A0A5C3KDQ3_COPMA|nr:TPR-like protein [Coprinopsis marcescibilis]